VVMCVVLGGRRPALHGKLFARDIRIEFPKVWSGIGVVCVVLLWVVVYAPTGPGASFSETPFSELWTRKCVCVCVCVCFINSPSVLFEKKCKEK